MFKLFTRINTLNSQAENVYNQPQSNVTIINFINIEQNTKDKYPIYFIVDCVVYIFLTMRIHVTF